MRRNWRQPARDAIRRNHHRSGLAGIVAGVGAAIAIGAMEWSSLESHTPLAIPFAIGTFHLPAGVNPLLVVPNTLPWSFLFAPVLAGTLLLTAFAGTAGSAGGRGRSGFHFA